MHPSTLSENIIFQNEFVTIYNNRVVLPNGAKTDHIKISAHPSNKKKQSHGVAVLPVTKDGKIILIKEYYYGIDDYLYVVPRGFVEERDIEKAASRELREETGYTAKSYKYVQRFVENPRIQDHTTHTFIAHDCVLTHGTNFDKGEVIEKPELFSPEEVLSMCQNGEIVDAITLLVFNLYVNSLKQ